MSCMSEESSETVEQDHRHNQDELQWMTRKAEGNVKKTELLRNHQDCNQTCFMRKEFNKKNNNKYTTRINVFTGRMNHAPGSKLVPTFARGRESVCVVCCVVLCCVVLCCVVLCCVVLCCVVVWCVVWCGVVWCGVVWCGVVWCGVVWCVCVCVCVCCVLCVVCCVLRC